MIRKNSFSLAALVLFVSVCMFTSCKFEPDASIIGTWKSTYDEVFKITASTFTNEYNGYVSYAGTIDNMRDDGSGAGYITIKLTENNYYPGESVNKFYVIHYKNLTDSTADIAGAYISGAPEFHPETGTGGKDTKAEAESTYTVAAGAFAFYSTCARQ